jgi:hypothetical protein
VDLGSAYRVPVLSVAGALLALPWLCFHILLTKPGGSFSGTRLSDKALQHLLLHTFAHEQLRLRSLELLESQLLVQMVVTELFLSITLQLELHAQQLTHLMADMTVDAPVGFAHRPDAKIVGPTSLTCAWSPQFAPWELA